MSAQALPTTVLLVEDDPSDALLITRALTGAAPGLRVEVVSDGQEAIDYLAGRGRFTDPRSRPFPSLLLLDLALPRIDGIQVLRWIREQPSLRSLVVVILTGAASAEQMRAAYDLHVNSFLKKTPLLSVPEVCRNVLGYWVRLNHSPPPRSDYLDASPRDL